VDADVGNQPSPAVVEVQQNAAFGLQRSDADACQLEQRPQIVLVAAQPRDILPLLFGRAAVKMVAVDPRAAMRCRDRLQASKAARERYRAGARLRREERTRALKKQKPALSLGPDELLLDERTERE